MGWLAPHPGLAAPFEYAATAWVPPPQCLRPLTPAQARWLRTLPDKINRQCRRLGFRSLITGAAEKLCHALIYYGLKGRYDLGREFLSSLKAVSPSTVTDAFKRLQIAGVGYVQHMIGLVDGDPLYRRAYWVFNLPPEPPVLEGEAEAIEEPAEVPQPAATEPEPEGSFPQDINGVIPDSAQQPRADFWPASNCQEKKELPQQPPAEAETAEAPAVERIERVNPGRPRMPGVERPPVWAYPKAIPLTAGTLVERLEMKLRWHQNQVLAIQASLACLRDPRLAADSRGKAELLIGQDENLEWSERLGHGPPVNPALAYEGEAMQRDKWEVEEVTNPEWVDPPEDQKPDYT